MSVEQISTKLIYANQWLRLREDRVRRQDGSEGIYSVVEREDFVVVIPLEDGRITLVEQYRYPVGQRLWEAPQGCYEPDRHTSVEDLAAAELREETGLTAIHLTRIGEIFQGPGYCTQKGHVFLATGVKQGPPERDHGEQDMVTKSFTVEEIERMIVQNEIKCTITVAAFGMLRLRGLL